VATFHRPRCTATVQAALSFALVFRLGHSFRRFPYVAVLSFHDSHWAAASGQGGGLLKDRCLRRDCLLAAGVLGFQVHPGLNSIWTLSPKMVCPPAAKARALACVAQCRMCPCMWPTAKAQLGIVRVTKLCWLSTSCLVRGRPTLAASVCVSHGGWSASVISSGLPVARPADSCQSQFLAGWPAKLLCVCRRKVFSFSFENRARFCR